MRRLSEEKGISGLIVAGIVLPIVALIFAALFDLSRKPLAQMALKRILLEASYGMEERAIQEGMDSNDGSIPPALNLLWIASGQKGLRSAIDQETGKALVEAACHMAGDRISVGNLSSYALSGAAYLSFQFFLIEFGIESSGTGGPGNTEVIERTAVSRASCLREAVRRTDYTVIGVLPPEEVAQKFLKDFESSARGLGGLWGVVGRSHEITSLVPGPETSTPPVPYALPSVWLIGVGRAEITNLFGNFFSQETGIVEYFVRPLEKVAFLQSTLVPTPSGGP